MTMGAEEKRCCRCRLVKFRTEFHRDANRPDGLQPRCKACVRENERKRVYTYTYRPGHGKYVRAYELQNPEVRKAWNALKAARNRGLITPWPVCAVPDCSKTELHAHHPDYSRPLDVVWLCPAHHRQAHKAHHE